MSTTETWQCQWFGWQWFQHWRWLSHCQSCVVSRCPWAQELTVSPTTSSSDCTLLNCKAAWWLEVKCCLDRQQASSVFHSHTHFPLGPWLPSQPKNIIALWKVPIILLGDRGTCVWTTYPGLLCESESNALIITPPCNTIYLSAPLV